MPLPKRADGDKVIGLASTTGRLRSAVREGHARGLHRNLGDGVAAAAQISPAHGALGPGFLRRDPVGLVDSGGSSHGLPAC
eukprot:6541539-Pyramimonas_sp.AAC.1